MSAAVVARFTVPATHPALPGHFPGRPIVPGVVLLDAVIAAARDHFGAGAAIGLPRAKFLSPVLPDEEVMVEIAQASGHRIAFTCRAGDRLVATGEVDFGS